VQPSNTSEIGQLARELYTSKDATLINAPSFQKTLFYMLEIGFLKLQRDFSFAAMCKLKNFQSYSSLLT